MWLTGVKRETNQNQVDKNAASSLISNRRAMKMVQSSPSPPTPTSRYAPNGKRSRFRKRWVYKGFCVVVMMAPLRWHISSTVSSALSGFARARRERQRCLQALGRCTAVHQGSPTSHPPRQTAQMCPGAKSFTRWGWRVELPIDGNKSTCYIPSPASTPFVKSSKPTKLPKPPLSSPV